MDSVNLAYSRGRTACHVVVIARKGVNHRSAILSELELRQRYPMLSYIGRVFVFGESSAPCAFMRFFVYLVFLFFFFQLFLLLLLLLLLVFFFGKC